VKNRIAALRCVAWIAMVGMASAQTPPPTAPALPPLPTAPSPKAATPAKASTAPSTSAPAPTPAPGTPATLPASAAPAAAPGTAATTNRIALPPQFPRPGATAKATNAAAGAGRPGAGPATAGPARPGAPGAPGAGAAKPGTPAAPGQQPVSNADQEANDAAIAAAQDAETPEELVESVKFRNMELEQMLDGFYSRLTGRTVLRGQGLNLKQQITYLPTKTLSVEETIQALDTVMALNAITTIPTGENFILVVPSQQAMQMGSKFSNVASTNYAEASQFVTHVVQLKHLDPKEASELVKVFASAQGANGIVALESTKTLILRDFAINVKRMLELIARVDIEIEDEFILEVIPIRYGKVEDIYQTMQSVISGSGGGGGMGSTGGATGTGGFGGGMGSGFNQGGMGGTRRGGFSGGRSGMGGFGGGFGGSGFNNGNRGGFYPNQASGPARVTTGTTGGQTFQSRLNASGRGQGGLGSLGELMQNANITADLRSNSLIVYARKKDIAKIKEVVAKVDTLLAQVLIEAIIMEVSLQDSLNYGVTAGQRPKQFNGDPKVVGGGVMNNGGNALGTGNQFLGGIAQSASNFPSGSGLTYFMQLGNNWDVAMNALASDSRVNVIQRPRVLTSHATPGSFQVGQDIPFVTGSFFGGGFGNSTQIQRQFVGVGLDVIPFITPDSLVVMEITQNIDQLGPTFKIDNNEVPSTQTRTASSTVTVRNKESILLGGYINSNTSRSRSGVPGLSSVPILGNLFSSRSRTGSRTELMVLMRPTVLPTPTDAASMADAERARLPGVRVAEKEFERTEDAENNKADKLLRDAEKKASKKKKQ